MSKVTRTVTIKMDATVENFQRVIELVRNHTLGDKWEFSSTLDHTPLVGETWKDGQGKEVVLSLSNDKDHPLTGNNRGTWRSNGLYHNSDWNELNLVERVEEPVIVIKDGEYWMDGQGNIWQVSVRTCAVRPEAGYYIESRNSNGRARSWGKGGRYILNNRDPRDLVKKMVFADDCKGVQR